MTKHPCWTCAQPATHVFTREGSITLYACDNCTRIDRAEAESRGWTIASTLTTGGTHYGNDPMGAPTQHQGLLENCPAPECQDQTAESDDELAARVEQMDRDLDQVLDVEAGLAEVLHAGQAVDDGLDRLFRRLGPPLAEN